jgi:DNA-binding transcriptional regulator YiaG
MHAIMVLGMLTMRMSGKDFRDIRLHFDLTQSQWAEVLGLASHANISRWENKRRPLPETEAKLAYMLRLHGIPEAFHNSAK